MISKCVLRLAIAAALILSASSPALTRAQGKPASARALRCTFPLYSVGSLSREGAPEAAVKPSTLILRFDTINADEGTAELRDGTVGSSITLQLSNRNLHFIQSFRSGGLYVTTVFDQESRNGKLVAVHSRHELFKVPLDGATSSPEQYYGECEIVN